MENAVNSYAIYGGMICGLLGACLHWLHLAWRRLFHQRGLIPADHPLEIAADGALVAGIFMLCFECLNRRPLGLGCSMVLMGASASLGHSAFGSWAALLGWLKKSLRRCHLQRIGDFFLAFCLGAVGGGILVCLLASTASGVIGGNDLAEPLYWWLMAICGTTAVITEWLSAGLRRLREEKD